MKATKILALLLVLVMCFALFAGCTKDGGGTTTPTPSSGGSSSGGSSSSGSSSGTEPAAEPDAPTYPLVDNTVEFEIWAYNQAANYGVIDFNDCEAWQAVEKRTNVHINWILPSAADLMTSLNLTLVSELLPDSFMLYFSMLPGGLDAAIESGQIMDITELAQQYCPNYMAQVTATPEMWLGARTDTGKMPGFYGIKRTVQPCYGGPIARKDIMDDLGISIPYTLDEHHDMLIKLRDGGVEFPTTLASTGYAAYLMAPYNLDGRAWYQVDNKVHYSFIEDSFKDYLQMLHDWYAEGLIDSDFYTATTGSATKAKGSDTAYTLTGRLAVWNSTYQTIHSNMVTAAASGDTKYELVALPFPMQNKSDIRHLGDTPQDRWQGNMGSISPTCENKEILAKWYDYLFSDEGWVLSSYGAGSAYFIDENGHPRGNELITANPDDLTPYQAMNTYSMTPDIPTLYDWERELLVTMNDNALAAFDIWMANDDNAYAIPSMIFPTTEESARFSAVMGDVETYLNEIVVKFIIGDEPLSNFETMRQNIKNLGIDEAIGIKQAALDRFLAR